MMTNKQMDYAVSRVEEIFREKKAVLTKETDDWRELNILADLKNGTLKLKKHVTEAYRTSDLHQIFDFSVYEVKQAAAEKVHKVAIQKLTGQAKKIKDEIMLGDQERAMKLIEEFSK